MSTPIASRDATLDDLDALLATVQAGFDSYADFAPAGWQPPNAAEDRDRAADLLADPDSWALIALVDERPGWSRRPDPRTRAHRRRAPC